MIYLILNYTKHANGMSGKNKARHLYLTLRVGGEAKKTAVLSRNNIRGLRIGDEERQIGATLSGQRALYHGMHRRPDRDASGRRNVN
mgnify:CR=1 FL=1